MRSSRFLLLGAAIIAVNVVGVVWIHHDLVRFPNQYFSVLAASPQQAVQQADRLTLVLNEPLGQDRVGQSIDQPPFVIQPAAAGRWQWASADTLEYLLDKPLLPGRSYVVKPAADMERVMTRQLVGRREFVFATDPLRVAACLVGTSDREAVHVELVFNQPVSPDDLMRHLRVTGLAAADAKTSPPKLEVSCLTNQVGTNFVLRVPRPAYQEATVAVRWGGRPSQPVALGVVVFVDSKLTGFGAQLPLGTDFRQELKVSSRFALLGATVNEPGLDKDIRVFLRFSQGLDQAQGLPQVKVDPPVACIHVGGEDEVIAASRHAPGWATDIQVAREGDRIVLQGPFVCGKRYTATVAGTLLSADKQTLKEDSTATFDIPDRSPSISIAASRGILTPRGNLMLDVQAVNVPGVSVGASRLHANNLVVHLIRHRGDEYTSRPLKPQTIKLDLERNKPQTLALDLRKVLNEPLGVYTVSVSSTEQNWDNERAVVTITDLGLTAKRHKDGYTIWVTSLRTGKPMEDVTVTAITRNNQTIATAATDAQGLAQLSQPPLHPDGDAFVIVAQREGDMSYLQLGGRRDDEGYFDEVGQEGASIAGSRGRAATATYDVAMYAERGIYRPGETIHLTGIIRDAGGRIAPPMPLSLYVDRPDGKRVATIAIPADTSGQGVLHADYTPPEDGQMGSYHFSVSLPGATQPLGSLSSLVEAFVPVRMEVKAKATQELYGPGEAPRIEGFARYLFGVPGSDLPVEVGGNYSPANFMSIRHKDFVFDTNWPTYCWSARPSMVTDANGRFVASLQEPNGPKRLWTGSFGVTVTEPGGRSVSSSFEFKIDTIGRHIGLRLPPSNIIAVGQPANIDWVVLDANGDDSQGGQLSWTLQRVLWDWVVEQVNGKPVWKNRERTVAAGEGKLDGGAAGTLGVTPAESGQYRLTVKDAVSGAQAAREFYASRGVESSSNDEGVGAAKPEQLELVLDRKTYAPGTSVRVLVRSPFAGTLLLTMETDRILETRVLEMEGKQLEVELPVPAELRGGAFIAASVVRAVDPENAKWMPHRALGIVRMATDHSAARMTVAIEAPSKIEPGQTARVVVQTDKPLDPTRPGVVHLWAVDEGILMTTDFRTPDPYAFFFMPRSLGVSTSDLYWMLLPDYQRPAEIKRIGADSEGSERLRRSPVPIRQRANAVIWNKAVPVDADGRATVTIDVPRFTGELRLMAVTVDHDRYGHGHKAMTVASPLQVESSWPRFAAPGDRFKAPLKVFNTTGEALTVSLEIDANGPIQLSYTAPATQPASGPATGPASMPTSKPWTITLADVNALAGWRGERVREVEVPAGSSRIFWVYATATDLGPVDIVVHAAAGALRAQDEAKFAIRPAMPLTAETKLLKFDAGTAHEIAPLGDFLTGRTTVSLFGRSDIQLRAAIEQLIDYPYGCVEQTTSRLYAMLYAPHLLALDGGRERATAVKEMIEAGITRLWSMQTRDGGLGYWPGDSQSNLWGTAYAAGFLVRAKKAGFTVDKRFTDALADYIEATLKRTDAAELDDNMRAQMCNVLATFGRGSEGWMNRLSDSVNKLDVAGRSHLASAWLEMGKKDRAAAVLAPDTLKIDVSFCAGGRITSPVSQQAVLLDTLMELDPAHEWIPLLVAKLEQARRASGGWGSTHDNAMCLAALCHYQLLSKDKPSNFTGTLTLAGREPLPFDHDKPLIAHSDLPNSPIRLETTGQGVVFAVVTTEGLRRGGKVQEADNRLVVRRVWTDANGEPIDPRAMYVGQLVHVEVVVELPSDAGLASLDNIAVVDALPGGLEVENPKLNTSYSGGNTVVPSRVQFMDDRVVMFVTAQRGRQTYSYYLRATTTGRFELPPIQASCMYDADINSIHGGGVIEVADGAPARSATSKPATAKATSQPTTAKATTAPVADSDDADGEEMESPADDDDNDDDEPMTEAAAMPVWVPPFSLIGQAVN